MCLVYYPRPIEHNPLGPLRLFHYQHSLLRELQPLLSQQVQLPVLVDPAGGVAPFAFVAGDVACAANYAVAGGFWGGDVRGVGWV